MTAYIPTKPNQSIYDLCLMAYGSIDLLGRFGRDNGVTDTSARPALTQYQYETTLVRYKTAETYATKATIVADVCPVVTGLATTDIQETEISIEWASSGVMGYQYGYVEGVGEPSTWTYTTGTTGTITGLTGGTTYNLFVRAKCNIGFFSAPVSISAETSPAMPVPPHADKLVLSVFSFYGVDATGSLLTRWKDLSGKGNHLPIVTASPSIVPNIFGALPGVRFTSGTQVATVGNAIGIVGQSACTTFYVGFVSAPGGGNVPAVTYTLSGATSTPGEFSVYQQNTPLQVDTIARGNVGFDTGYIADTLDTPAVYAARLDYSETAVNELMMFKNGSSAGFVSSLTSENTDVFANRVITVGLANITLGAVLIYNVPLDNTQVIEVSDYLMSLFSIP